MSAQKDSKNIREEGSTRRREADGSMPVSKANEPRERSPNLFGQSNPFAPHISNRVFVYGWFIGRQGGIAPTREFKPLVKSGFLFGFQYLQRVRELCF